MDKSFYSNIENTSRKSAFSPYNPNSNLSLRISSSKEPIMYHNNADLQFQKPNIQRKNDDITVNYYFSIVFSGDGWPNNNGKSTIRSNMSKSIHNYNANKYNTNKSLINSYPKSTISSNFSKVVDYNSQISEKEKYPSNFISLPSGNIKNQKYQKHKTQHPDFNNQNNQSKKISYFTRPIYLPFSKTLEPHKSDNEKIYVRSFKQKGLDGIEDFEKSSVVSYYGDKEDSSINSDEDHASEYSSFLDDNTTLSDVDTVIENSADEDINLKGSAIQRPYVPYTPKGKNIEDPYLPNTNLREFNSEILLGSKEDNSTFQSLDDDQKNYIIKKLADAAKARASMHKKEGKIVNVF